MSQTECLETKLTWIDSHAHLDAEALVNDTVGILHRARAAGVQRIVSLGTDLSSSLANQQLAQRHSEVIYCAGVHAHEAAKSGEDDWPKLYELWQQDAVGIGEIGLDYYYHFSEPDLQRRIFTRQLEMSREMQLPVVIHVRDAFDDAFAILESVAPASGVLHCFTGGPKEAERALSLGLYLSFSGIVTFPKARDIQEAARLVPDDKLLIETDSPYLAPAPHRGKRNEPALVIHVGEKLAELRQQDVSTLAALTVKNAMALFLKVR